MVTLIVVSDGTCNHTGSVCGGAVAGTLTVGSNSFVTIEGNLIMDEDGTLEVPTHNNPPCVPPNNQSHSLSIDSFGQSFVTIEGKKMVLVGDANTGGDATDVNGAGSNSFVSI